jgi:ATP/maltotriose-dependent transcriptional regulator MalT
VAGDTLNIHILPTKLNRPTADSNWVYRSRLIARFDESLAKRLTLLSAPAGIWQNDPGCSMAQSGF